MWMVTTSAANQQLKSMTLSRALQDDAVLAGGKPIYMRPQGDNTATEMIPIFSINAFYVDQGIFQISVPSGFGDTPSLGCDISHLDADAEVLVPLSESLEL